MIECDIICEKIGGDRFKGSYMPRDPGRTDAERSHVGTYVENVIIFLDIPEMVFRHIEYLAIRGGTYTERNTVMAYRIMR